MRGLWAAVAGLALAGLTGAANAETLTVGAYPANPPWEVKQEDGSFSGFEVDLVNAIGAKLGATVEYQDLGFQALFAATASGRIDAAISSITITDERLKSQDFTQGYYDADIGIGTREDTGVASLEDLRGQAVGVLAGSTGEQWVQAHREEYGFSDVRSYPAYENMLLDTRNGRVAAAISDVTGMLYAFKQMPGMAVVDRIRSGDRYAIMLGKNSPWTARMNDAVGELKRDGTLARIYETHFGVAPEADSATVTVLDLPRAAE